MKILYLLFTLVYSDKMIRNVNIPACRNCIHFQPSKYDSISSGISKCANFGNKDIISDEVTMDYADLCRKDESKCGIEGKYFEKEPNLEFKMWKHSFYKDLSMNIFYLSVVLYLFACIYIGKNT